MSQGAVVVCTWGLRAETLEEQLGEPLTLARKLGGELRLLVLGAMPDATAREAGRFGAKAVDHITSDALNEVKPDAYIAALSGYAETSKPHVWVFAQTFDARLIAARHAGRLGIGTAMNCVDVTVEGNAVLATCAAFGGDTRVIYRLGVGEPCLISVNPNAVLPEPVAAPDVGIPVAAVSAVAALPEERIRLIEKPQAALGPRLEHATIVVAGGRGLGTKENFKLVEDLASALGGMAAASRPIVDDGWAKPPQQVGLTGKITKPALYIAAGISGASQHMVGCAAAKRLVAINSDASAAIFRYAHYGIVGNCLEILPALTSAAPKAK